MKTALFKLLMLVLLTSCTTFSGEKYTEGNGQSSQPDIGEHKDLEGEENKYLSKISSNLVQTGIICEGDNVIYYFDSNDECIYSIDKDGKNKKIITDAKATNLLYYKGKLYFKNFIQDKYKSVLCSINADGTDYKVISDEVVNTFYIYDDMLYYKTKDYSLYAYDINSGSHSLVMGPEVAGSIIYKNKLYYYDEGFYGNILEYDLVNKTEKFRPIFAGAYLQYYDESLYFYSDGYITRYNINTEEVTQIFNDKQNKIATGFISITKDYIFFTGQTIDSQGKPVMSEDKKNLYKLYRIKHDGSELTTIYENKVAMFNIIDDKIFVTNNIEYSKKKDGTYLRVIDFDGNELDWDI